MRLLVQQNIKDTRECLSQSVCQSQLEETILHYNFNMLENVFCEEHQKRSRKMDLASRLRISSTEWQMKIKEKLDLGKYAQDPARFTVFPEKLPSYGTLRKLHLVEQLKTQTLDAAAMRRLTDSTGMIRCHSVLGVKEGAVVTRSAALEEKPILYKDFLCAKPKHGYVPRFTRPAREVPFVPPVNPFP